MGRCPRGGGRPARPAGRDAAAPAPAGVDGSLGPERRAGRGAGRRRAGPACRFAVQGSRRRRRRLGVGPAERRDAAAERPSNARPEPDATSGSASNRSTLRAGADAGASELDRRGAAGCRPGGGRGRRRCAARDPARCAGQDRPGAVPGSREQAAWRPGDEARTALQAELPKRKQPVAAARCAARARPSAAPRPQRRRPVRRAPAAARPRAPERRQPARRRRPGQRARQVRPRRRRSSRRGAARP